MKVTCWYRQNKDNRGYFYNHYEEGHTDRLGIKHGQTQWLKDKWLYEHTELINGVVLDNGHAVEGEK